MPVAMMICMLVLTVTADLWTDRIPDALTLTGLVAGLLHGYEKAGFPGLLTSAAASAGIFGICFLLFMIKAMRGGDGKLLSALAAMTGFTVGVKILMLSLLIAMLIGLPAVIAKRFRGRTYLHFSVPILLAALIVMTGRW